MDRRRIGIVIPALNEGSTIVSVVMGASVYGRPIVVDDGSTDRTASFAAESGAVIVSHESNRGYDESLNSGFRKAHEIGCDYVITMDADGQHDPTTLARFVNALDTGADVVVGVRDRRQRFAEHVFAWVSQLRWGIRDPLCGVKGYHLELYEELGHFDSYGSIGTELAIFAASQGRILIEVPVPTKDREEESRFGGGLLANLRILRAMWCALWHLGLGRS